MVQFRIDDRVTKTRAPFDTILVQLASDAQALNEGLWEPGAELRACDDAWKYYSAHLEAKDIPVKIRPCEVEHAVY